MTVELDTKVLLRELLHGHFLFGSRGIFWHWREDSNLRKLDPVLAAKLDLFMLLTTKEEETNAS